MSNAVEETNLIAHEKAVEAAGSCTCRCLRPRSLFSAAAAEIQLENRLTS